MHTDIQYIEHIQHNVIVQNDIQHNGTDIQHYDTQLNDIQHSS